MTHLDHPRSRGEYPGQGHSGPFGMGSSPLSRGILDWVLHGYPSRGIIPALAGNTRAAKNILLGCTDHPRSRGEYPNDPERAYWAEGSSPLSRGIPARGGPAARRVRIIPALAGNTLARAARSALRSDHPRSRGEYDRGGRDTSSGPGSSPLSRGILNDLVVLDDQHGIIPALAGNTKPGTWGMLGIWDHPRSRGEYDRGVGFELLEGGSSPLSRGILLPCRMQCGRGRIIPALAGNTSCPARDDM